MTMYEIRLLEPGDEEPLQRFLSEHRDGAHLLHANLGRGGIEDRGVPYQGTYAACLHRGAVTAVAAHYWNGMLLFHAEEATERVARFALDVSGRRLEGLFGPWEQVLRAARSLDIPKGSAGLDEPQRLMALDLTDLIVPGPLACGELVCRRARSSELELLYNWRAAFEAETTGRRGDLGLRAAARQMIDQQQRSGDNWVLTRDGRLLAGCTVIGETGEAVQIGGVITPQNRRNRGYGRAVVAGTLRVARDRGRARALLITNNPAAERAYRAIGFGACGEVGLVRLARAAEVPDRGRDACNSEPYGVVSARAGRGFIDGPASRPAGPQAASQVAPQVTRS